MTKKEGYSSFYIRKYIQYILLCIVICNHRWIEKQLGSWVTKAEHTAQYAYKNSELNCVLCPTSNVYVEILSPSTSEYDLIWKQGHYRNNQLSENQVILEQYWSLIQYDRCPREKGIWSPTCTQGKRRVKIGAELPETKERLEFRRKA